MAGFDEVPFELIAECNHFCNLIANQQNAAIEVFAGLPLFQIKGQ